MSALSQQQSQKTKLIVNSYVDHHARLLFNPVFDMTCLINVVLLYYDRIAMEDFAAVNMRIDHQNHILSYVSVTNTQRDRGDAIFFARNPWTEGIHKLSIRIISYEGTAVGGIPHSFGVVSSAQRTLEVDKMANITKRNSWDHTLFNDERVDSSICLYHVTGMASDFKPVGVYVDDERTESEHDNIAIQKGQWEKFEAIWIQTGDVISITMDFTTQTVEFKMVHPVAEDEDCGDEEEEEEDADEGSENNSYVYWNTGHLNNYKRENVFVRPFDSTKSYFVGLVTSDQDYQCQILEYY